MNTVGYRYLPRANGKPLLHQPAIAALSPSAEPGSALAFPLQQAAFQSDIDGFALNSVLETAGDLTGLRLMDAARDDEEQPVDKPHMRTPIRPSIGPSSRHRRRTRGACPSTEDSSEQSVAQSGEFADNGVSQKAASIVR